MWTFVGGTTQTDSVSYHGVKGQSTPGARPSSRSESHLWTLDNGVVVLFGGRGYGSSTVLSGALGSLNDMWVFKSGNWTWIHGETTVNSPGNVPNATLISLSSTVPPGTYGGANWLDSDGSSLWLFGGVTDFDQGSSNLPFFIPPCSRLVLGSKNTLWLFRGGNWRWMHGQLTPGAKAAHNDQGVPDSVSTPGAQYEGTVEVDDNGVAWLYGGYGRSLTNSVGS